MRELSLQSTVDGDVRTSWWASEQSRQVLRRKGFAGLLGVLLMGATLAPIAQNWRPTPQDSFPFSYYPMFAVKRGDTYEINYLVGVDGEGNRKLIRHQFAGKGGFNQTRHQINRFVWAGKADVLCEAVARKVARKGPPYSGIVTIRVVTGQFRFSDYFAGNKAPLTERVQASCTVARGEQTAEDKP